MKKLLGLTTLLLAGMATLSSCSEEPLNAECDIEAISLHLDNPIKYFYHDYDTLQAVPSTVTDITFTIRSYENVGSLPVTLKVTPGAKVYQCIYNDKENEFHNGQMLDFSDEQVQQLMVVSEDGQWNRLYNICVKHDLPSEGNMTFDFNDYELDGSGKYYVWNITDQNAVNGLFGGVDATWKNGNPGFKLSKSSAKPLEYPSTPVVGGGPDGSDCVKLETMDTGAFGNMVNMRMAAGSMFLGEFDVANALKDALKATRFGLPFTHKPVKLSVWLKYEASSKPFQDKMGKPVEGIVDEPDAYIVVYRNQDENGNRVMLDGNDVLINKHIVGMARLPHHTYLDENGIRCDQLGNDPIHGLTAEWQEVVLDVEYSQELDPEILANKGYSIVIGFACSWQGAYFNGSIGNKLYIDNVKVICE